MALIDALLRRAVRKGTLTVTHADGRTAQFGTPVAGFPDVAIRFADAGVAREILRDPRLGAAETFMDGRLVIERGDVMDLVGLMRANQSWDKGGSLEPPNPLRRLGNRIASGIASVNRAGSARRNAAHHYDIGNVLYELMLDAPWMQYSCAYWPHPGMTLEAAQEAKLAHIAAKLMLARERVRAAGLEDRITLELVDYRALARRGVAFDRIVSVGMFEHVGRPQFETFFRSCAAMLAEHGVMLLHTIGRMGTPGHTDAFTRKYIFPGAYIPALSETLAASEQVRLIATDIETLRMHYAYTLREWHARCVARRDAIVQLFDERFYRMWTFYLAGATAAFEHGGMCNYQIQFTRRRRVLPITRDYMAQAEARLQES